MIALENANIVFGFVRDCHRAQG
eukprot:SAG11_NODE_27832_length_328_cov_1.061135_1_plen_22_part_01